MSIQARVSHPLYNFLPTEIEGFDSLAELALDLSSSWNHANDEVWRRLDPILWELTQNPWVVLQTVSRDRIESVLSDPVFRKTVDDLLQSRRQAANLVLLRFCFDMFAISLDNFAACINGKFRLKVPF